MSEGATHCCICHPPSCPPPHPHFSLARSVGGRGASSRDCEDGFAASWSSAVLKLSCGQVEKERISPPLLPHLTRSLPHSRSTTSSSSPGPHTKAPLAPAASFILPGPASHPKSTLLTPETNITQVFALPQPQEHQPPSPQTTLIHVHFFSL